MALKRFRPNNSGFVMDGAHHGWGDGGEGWHFDEVLEDTFVGVRFFCWKGVNEFESSG